MIKCLDLKHKLSKLLSTIVNISNLFKRNDLMSHLTSTGLFFMMSCLYKNIKSFKIYEWKQQQLYHKIPLLLFPESIFSQ